MPRGTIKTKISAIINYWASRVDECGLSVDWAEADSHCWRCGCEKNLERCHIVPASLGGFDSPDNLVLLCKRCHAENPNVTDKEIMWDWIRSYGVPLYGTFWSIRGMQEYKFIYKKSVRQELIDIGLTPDDVEKEFNAMYKELFKEAGVHFGQPYFNSATIAGLFRMMIKSLAKKNGKQLAKTETESRTPWWMAET
jgi:hypothetical protein